MNILRALGTPSSPAYWVMLCLPNLIILLFALRLAQKNRLQLLIAVAALGNVLAPLLLYTCERRSNGLNAPGVPQWVYISGILMMINIQTIALFLAFVAAWRTQTRQNKSVEQAGPAYPPQGVGSADP